MQLKIMFWVTILEKPPGFLDKIMRQN